MADFLEKVVYLTDAQYNTLAGGGTVGTLTGINNNYIYLTDSMVTLNDLDASIRQITIAGNVISLGGTLATNTLRTSLDLCLSTSLNGIAYYTNTDGKLEYIRTANGAFYSTGQDVKAQFGTLPVGQGGTGNTSFTANRLVWTESATKLVASHHYVSSSQVNINSTSAPASGYAFGVSGSANITTSALIKNITISENTIASNNTLYLSSVTSASLIFRKGDTEMGRWNTSSNLIVGVPSSPNNITDKLYVEGTTKFNGNATHNGIVYFANGTTYYINNSGTANLLDVTARSFGVSQTTGAGAGISLYGGATGTAVPTYGIIFGVTSTFGKFGDVSGDWATYFIMNRADNRGWIFKSNGSTADTNNNYASISGRGHFTGSLTPGSWLDGQRYTNAAYNIADYSNKDNYNPWMRATNTWASGVSDAKVGRWFSFGTLGNEFYWMGSTTSRTANAYDKAMSYDISTGALTINTLIKTNANRSMDAQLITGATGTANSGDGNNTRGTQGEVYLQLGNATALPAAGTAGGANNARGYLRIYGTQTNYANLYTQDQSSNRNFWLPDSNQYNNPILMPTYALSGTQDLNTIYNAGIYCIEGGGATNYPAGGSAYANLLVMPYSKPAGNTTPYHAFQIYNNAGGNRLWFRGSNDNAYAAWREVAHIAADTSVGSYVLPVYVTASGVVTAVSDNSLIVNLATTGGASVYSSAPRPGVTGTLPVGNGGTGATTLTSGYALIGNGTSAIKTRGIRNNTSAGALGWTSVSAGTTLVTTNTIAYWNGAYSGTTSRLAYCNKGAFGTMATKTATDYIAKAIGTAKGDIIYWTADKTPARLPIGSTGQYLTISNGFPTWANITLSDYLPLSGGTMTGKLILKQLAGQSEYTYGDTLPSSPEDGDIFFQISAPIYELPAGGSTGQCLVKTNGNDREVKWANAGKMIATASKFYVGGSSLNVDNTEGTYFNTNVYVENNVLMGAAWNDYAEYRITKEAIEPGRCIVENGDNTLSLSTERLQPGAEIVSDTFGFAIGYTELANTPIAVTGRVLAYPYEDIEEFKPGYPVCSGPNGTVSVMTDEEARMYPWLIIGTVSGIPTEEYWGIGHIQVNNRVWIRMR